MEPFELIATVTVDSSSTSVLLYADRDLVASITANGSTAIATLTSSDDYHVTYISRFPKTLAEAAVSQELYSKAFAALTSEEQMTVMTTIEARDALIEDNLCGQTSCDAATMASCSCHGDVVSCGHVCNNMTRSAECLP